MSHIIKTEHLTYSYVTEAELSENGLQLADLDTGIDGVRSLIGVEIALFLKEVRPGEFKISLRSTGADVSLIAKEFGGGGHVRAAGCTVSGTTADDAISAILFEIEKIYQ